MEIVNGCFDVKSVLTIFIDFQKEIESFCFEGFYIREGYERFCDELIEQKKILMLGLHVDLLGMLINLKAQKNKF